MIGQRLAGGAGLGDLRQQISGQAAFAHRFHQYPDSAAAGQPDGKGIVIADPIGQQSRRAIGSKAWAI